MAHLATRLPHIDIYTPNFSKQLHITATSLHGRAVRPTFKQAVASQHRSGREGEPWSPAFTSPSLILAFTDCTAAAPTAALCARATAYAWLSVTMVRVPLGRKAFLYPRKMMTSASDALVFPDVSSGFIVLFILSHWLPTRACCADLLSLPKESRITWRPVRSGGSIGLRRWRPLAGRTYCLSTCAASGARPPPDCKLL